MVDTQVLIVGAGPTGLTLAVALGQKGVRCTLIEQKDAPQFLPKMERCNARTMEIYRRMGIVDQVRAAGLPAVVVDSLSRDSSTGCISRIRAQQSSGIRGWAGRRSCA